MTVDHADRLLRGGAIARLSDLVTAFADTGGISPRLLLATVAGSRFARQNALAGHHPAKNVLGSLLTPGPWLELGLVDGCTGGWSETEIGDGVDLEVERELESFRGMERAYGPSSTTRMTAATATVTKAPPLSSSSSSSLPPRPWRQTAAALAALAICRRDPRLHEGLLSRFPSWRRGPVPGPIHTSKIRPDLTILSQAMWECGAGAWAAALATVGMHPEMLVEVAGSAQDFWRAYCDRIRMDVGMASLWNTVETAWEELERREEEQEMEEPRGAEKPATV